MAKPAVVSTPETAVSRRNRRSWILPAILLGIYLLIKVQGWIFAAGARTLERQLDELRPALSALALSDQLKGTIKSYEEGVRQIREQHLAGELLLKELSELPASFVLNAVELRPETIRISGSFLAGVRDPEKALILWAQTLRDTGSRVWIRKLAPFEGESGRWEFEIQVEAPRR